ncbi:MAG: acetolactate synthase [Oscillospiraceae bacterium]|nr:acetolactate synthase [Oscillospiraceae bacterium]
MTIKQLSIFVENEAGKLVEALETLADAKIDMRALSLADTENYGILRIIADKPEQALTVLSDAGFVVKVTDVIPVAVGDKPGGFAAVLRILADAGIDVEYTYAFVAHSHDSAYVILRVSDNDAAVNVLTKGDVTILTPEKIYEM